jgi:nitric oxide dioxygenase
MALTAAQVAIVKSTAPILKEHGKTITTTFYRNMLGAHPELKNYFSLRNQQTGAQQAALANSVLAYATYIDDLGKISPAVERIAQKHVSLFIKPEHYPIVGTHLIGAIGEVLGSALTNEIKDAWVAAYGQLADIFIQREGQLYDANTDWKTWRKFKITKKEAENDSVTSFYLEPTDNKPLPKFLPGQYVSVQIPIPELDGLLQSRQFSLSEAPGTNHYRISIKLQGPEEEPALEDLRDGKIAGLLSTRLHKRYNVGDEVELSPPAGEFFLNPADPASAKKPLVLLSAGVGATPLVSILDSVLSSESASRPITWIHGARYSGSTCFVPHVLDSAKKHDNITAKIFLEDVKEGDQYDFKGEIDLARLQKEQLLQLDRADAEYFICGPEDWMINVRAFLEENGVPRGRQHLELFKTGDV